jgi:predicted glycoside hydrolase/deacetylase ChbG (UPF0249 family)
VSRRLLINCDDLGMHPCIDRAIVDLMRRTPIRSASLMPTGNAFASAVERLREAGIASVGVHLALGSEYAALPTGPVAPRDEVATLVDERGRFFPDMAGLRGRLSLDEAERELRAQIARVEATGLELSHLDGHMFFYEVEEAGSAALLELVRQLARERGLPVRDRSARTTYFVWEGYDDAPARARYYERLLDELGEGEAELILHPADDAAALRAFTGAGARRLGDYEYFRAPAWLRLAAERGVEVIGWSEVVAR